MKFEFYPGIGFKTELVMGGRSYDYAFDMRANARKVRYRHSATRLTDYGELTPDGDVKKGRKWLLGEQKYLELIQYVLLRRYVFVMPTLEPDPSGEKPLYHWLFACVEFVKHLNDGEIHPIHVNRALRAIMHHLGVNARVTQAHTQMMSKLLEVELMHLTVVQAVNEGVLKYLRKKITDDYMKYIQQREAQNEAEKKQNVS